MRNRKLASFAVLFFLGASFLLRPSLYAEAVLSEESRSTRSTAQQERLCGSLAAQLNRSIESFDGDFGPITSKTQSTLKLPSQIDKYGKLVKVDFAQQLSVSYLEIENQNNQIVEIATAGKKNLQKLDVNVDGLRGVMALYGEPDVSEGNVVRYECDMNFEEFSAVKSNTLSIRIGSHVD